MRLIEEEEEKAADRMKLRIEVPLWDRDTAICSFAKGRTRRKEVEEKSANIGSASFPVIILSSLAQPISVRKTK